MADQPVQDQGPPVYLPSIRSMGLLGDGVNNTLPPMLSAQPQEDLFVPHDNHSFTVVVNPRENQGPGPQPKYHHPILHPYSSIPMPSLMDLGIHPSTPREERLSYPEGILPRLVYQVQNPAYVAKDSHTLVALDRLDKSLGQFVHPGRYRPAIEMLIPCETMAKKLALSAPGLPAPEAMRYKSCLACEACKHNASLLTVDNNQDLMEGVRIADALYFGQIVGEQLIERVRAPDAFPVAPSVGVQPMQDVPIANAPLVAQSVAVQPMEGVMTANALLAAQDVGIKLEASQAIRVHACHGSLERATQDIPEAPPSFTEIGRLMFNKLHRDHPGEIFDPLMGRMRKRMLIDDFPERAGHLKDQWDRMTVDQIRQHPLYWKGAEDLEWVDFKRFALHRFLKLTFPRRRHTCPTQHPCTNAECLALGRGRPAQ